MARPRTHSPDDPEPLVVVSLRVPRWTKHGLSRLARDLNRSQTAILIEALRPLMDQLRDQRRATKRPCGLRPSH